MTKKDTPGPLPTPKMDIDVPTIKPNIFLNTMPSVHIIGCGGAGTNRIKMFRTTDVRLSVIDTSRANLIGIDDRITIDVIDDTDHHQEGSGKIRKTNAQAIQKAINRLEQLKETSDISVIVHSMAGGSGSVIGPCVAKFLALEQRPFIVIGIVDAASKHFTQNSINTLLSYQAIAEQNGLYIPIKIFHNKESRGGIDNQITEFIHEFINMFTNKNVAELDITDKQNHLRPYLTEPHVGVYEFDLFTRDQKINITESVHSLLTITESGDSYEFDIDSNMQFAGRSSTEWYISVTGKPIDPDILSDLQKNLDRFDTIVDKGSNVVSGIRSKKAPDSSGFVL